MKKSRQTESELLAMPPAAASSATSQINHAVTDSDIARRVYERFLERGAEHGHDLADGLEAERERRQSETPPVASVLMGGTSERARLTAEALERICSEYLEMPGLRLKSAQVQRLCGVDRTICQDVLNALVETKFLSRKPDGAYSRVTDGAEIPRPRSAKGTLSELTIHVPQAVAADIAGRFR